MPVFIYEKEAFDKMVQVEGRVYREFKSKNKMGFCSFEAFLEMWEELDKQIPNFRHLRPEFGITSEGGSGAIYGFHGWNRYILLNSGEITLLKISSLPRYVKKARKIGFRIFPEDIKIL